MDGHDGRLAGNTPSKRLEEHLAMAIWRFRDMRWPRPGGGWFRFLDYQFPLKDAQVNPGVGKVDLLGVTDCGRLVVSELKVKRSNGRGESPMDALMQGLRYAAIVDANSNSIGCEADIRFRGIPPISQKPPVVQLLAPKAWWRGWLQLKDSTRRVAGHWEPRFAALVDDIEDGLGITVECLELDDVGNAELYERPDTPTLPKVPTLRGVRLGEPRAT